MAYNAAMNSRKITAPRKSKGSSALCVVDKPFPINRGRVMTWSYLLGKDLLMLTFPTYHFNSNLEEET